MCFRKSVSFIFICKIKKEEQYRPDKESLNLKVEVGKQSYCLEGRREGGKEEGRKDGLGQNKINKVLRFCTEENLKSLHSKQAIIEFYNSIWSLKSSILQNILTSNIIFSLF